MKRKLLIFTSIILISALAVGAELMSFYKAKFSGLNNSVNVRLLQDDESSDVSNFSLDEIGSIKERDLFGQYNSTSGALGSNFITGLFKHYTTDNKYFLACAGSKVALGSGGTFTDVTPTANTVTGGFWSGVSFNNKFYLFNPSVGMQIFDNSHSNVYPAVNAPGTNCSYSATHKGRVWAARSDNLPYRLYWSSLNDGSNWSATGGYADLPDINLEITGIISWGGYLYIFTETNIYILLGSTPNDFSLRKTNSMVGAIAPRSIKVTDAGICFLSRSGVYAFDGNNSNKISVKIDATVNSISKSLIQNSCAIYDGKKYWLSFTPSGESYNKKIIIYDIYLKDWTVYQGDSCNISYFERAYGGTDKGELYGGSSTTNGIVYQLQSAGGTESINHSSETDLLNQVTFNTVVTNKPSVQLDNGIDDYAKLLSHFNGVDGAVAYTAETGQVFTFNGTSQLDTAQKVFGLSSFYTSSTATLPASTNWVFAGDFTIDFRVRFNALVAGRYYFILGHQTDGAVPAGWEVWYTHATGLSFWAGSGGGAPDIANIAAPVVFTTGQWYHIAVVRKSGVIIVYVNGVAKGTATTTAIVLGNNTLYLGSQAYGGPGDPFNGWIDELRIKQNAHWSADFSNRNLQEYKTFVDNGTLTSQPIQINSAGLTTLSDITWSALYPTNNTRVAFQTRTGVTNDTVYFNGWQAWTSQNTVTVNTVTCGTVTFVTNDATNFGVYVPRTPQARNVLYYEDEDNVSPNCVTFNTVGAVSKGKFAWTSIAPVDVSSYDWLGIWYKSPSTGNTVEFSIGESLATENTVTFNTVQVNTWEKAYWYIGGITSTARDAITKISVQYRGDTKGSVVLGETRAYNFYDSGDTMTSTPNDWIQYRTILGSSNAEDFPELYSVTLTYTPALSVSEGALSSYYYTKWFDFKTPQLNKQFDSIVIEANSTTSSSCTLYCDYDIDFGTKTGTFTMPITSTANTVRLYKNFPSSVYGKAMRLKIYNSDKDAQISIKGMEIRYRTESVTPD